MILADVVFPASCALLAWILAGRLARTVPLRLLLTVGLLFGQELVSFGCSAVWDPDGRWHIAFVRSLASPWGHRLVPDYSTAYLSLFRTPEPQVSQAILFGALTLLIDLTRREAGDKRGRLLLLLGFLLNAGLGIVYLFTASAILVTEGLTALLLLYHQRFRAMAVAGALVLAGLASIALASVAYGGSAGDPDPGTFLFRSRLPILTPAVIVAALGLALVRLRKPGSAGEAAGREVALASFGAVLVLTNQQLLTGWMVSARDWERYVNYPLVLVGLTLLGVGPADRGQPRRYWQWAAAGALLLVAFLLVRAQLRVFAAFLPENQASLAMKRALERVRDPALRQARLVLTEPLLAPLLQVRAEKRLDCLIDYTQLLEGRVGRMTEEGGAWGLRSPFRDRLFEFFARTGRDPGEAGRLLRLSTLRLEAGTKQAQSGLLLGQLFNLRDYWHPITDGRGGSQPEIRSMLPKIAEAYERYLATGAGSWSEPALLLTTQPPAGRVGPERFQETLLAQATAGSGAQAAVTAYVLVQTPHVREARP
jgi:hypothetical protein